MSSTEEYLDSLLRSVMSGKKPPAPIDLPSEENEPAAMETSESVPVSEQPAPVMQEEATAPEQPVFEQPAPEQSEQTVITPEETFIASEDTLTSDVPVMPTESASPREHVSFIGSIMSEIPSSADVAE